MDDTERRQVIDEENLRLLSLGYFVMGGVHAVVAFFPLLYALMGIMFMWVPPHVGSPPGPEARLIGWILVGATASGYLVAASIAQLEAGRFLRARQSRTFCLVVAGLSCLLMPYGTLLGVFTFIVLGRPAVQAVFDAPRAERALVAP